MALSDVGQPGMDNSKRPLNRSSCSMSSVFRAPRSCWRGKTSAAARRANTRHGHCSKTAIRVAIAPSFGDIFYNNSLNNGLLVIRLPEAQVDRLFPRLRRSWLPVDGRPRPAAVRATDGSFAFAFRHRCSRRDLLNGWDDISPHAQEQRRDPRVRGEAPRGTAVAGVTRDFRRRSSTELPAAPLVQNAISSGLDAKKGNKSITWRFIDPGALIEWGFRQKLMRPASAQMASSPDARRLVHCAITHTMKILILPGDGIGPEIVGQAVRVLKKFKAEGCRSSCRMDCSAARRIDAHGHPRIPR